MKMGESSITRRCPKCNGYIYLDNDFHGWYEECLQCGYIRDVVEVCKAQLVESNTKSNNSNLVVEIR